MEFSKFQVFWKLLTFFEFCVKFWSIITSSIFDRFFWFWSQNIANACTKKSISVLCLFMLSYKQYIRIIHFSCFFFHFSWKCKKMITFWKKNDIWQYTSVAKTFLFNINLELQKSDENWRRNNTLKSAHTVKNNNCEKNANEVNQQATSAATNTRITSHWTLPSYPWMNWFSMIECVF